jgi:hypothetical protein
MIIITKIENSKKINEDLLKLIDKINNPFSKNINKVL